ncbi:MAG: hypothetical protein ABI688_09775 [Bacteroidota bacterium]
MIRTVKSLVLITISAFLFHSVHAQLRLPVIDGVGKDVKKVIEDYPNHFANLMGEMSSQNTQSTDYQCNFTINGAEEATITRYSAKKEVCSWQAVMLTTENFEKAKQKFRALYNQLNNLPVDITGGKNFRLKGKYDTPAEEKKFSHVLFSFEPSNDLVKKLKVEISIEYQAPMEWKVKVQVYDKEREDDERGKMVEE